MRIAVLILGLVLGALMGAQSYQAYSSPFFAENDPDMVIAGAAGIFMTLLWLFASALVFAFPVVSAILFAVASVIGFGLGAETRFTDLTTWGAASLILAIFSFIAWKSMRRSAEQAAARHAELLAAIKSGQHSP